MRLQFIHIILAFSVFLSSGGFWVNSHFCQKKLVKAGLFSFFGGCCEKSVAPCSQKTKTLTCEQETPKDNCCDTKVSFYKLDQDQLLSKATFKSFELDLSPSVVGLLATNYQIPFLDKSHLKFYTYVPPPIVFDRQVRLQTFLC